MRDRPLQDPSPPQPPPQRPPLRRGVEGALLALTLLLLVAGGWIWFAPCWLGGCAPIEEMARFQAEGSQLLDVNGEPFGVLATVNRRVVPLDSLPPHLVQAFLAVEDQRFYSHHGIDAVRMLGATVANVRRRGVAEGGSTISMQLARNLFPEQLPYTERSLRRKLLEVRIARQLERSFPKDKILELYVNHIYLGSGAYGVEAASQKYFGKPAAEVTLAEAALLGGLPKAPTLLDPTRNREGAQERRNLVLREMAEAGYVASDEAEAAREEPVRLARSRDDDSGMRGSYFIERVRRELEEQVGDRFYTAGLRVHTTLDPVAQAAAEEELELQLRRIESGQYGTYRHPTYEQARGVSAEAGLTPYMQGMAVVMDPHTGAVHALVGGRDWNDSKFDRAMQALRQPGSAFKPFVYLAALERFRSPVHRVEDSPLRLALPGGRVWEPRNYGGRYDGMMTLRDALARSKNTATVRLAQEVGLGPALRLASDLGISSPLPDLPSTALGAAEVRPMELVVSFAAFTNGGQRVKPHFVSRIEDRDGRLLWEAVPERLQVVNPATAFVLTSMLRDVVDRGTATAVRAAGFGGPAAGKTGTTNGNTDVWFIGYTPDLVGGVWIGLDNPQTIVHGASGGTLAAPVWGRMMSRIYRTRRMPPPWSPPAGVVREEVERGTGAVISMGCPARGPTYTEYFVSSPPSGFCPGDHDYPPLAAGPYEWGDEEWDTGYSSSDTLADRGIVWPELERLRRAGGVTDETTDTSTDGERRAVISPPADAVVVEPGEPVEEGQRVDTILAPVRESELPGVPVQPETPRDPPPASPPGDTGGAAEFELEA